jgi:hypothetical protein
LDISVDGVWCHAAFARDRHLHFRLLADFAPKGEVATKYRASAGARACADHPYGIRRLFHRRLTKRRYGAPPFLSEGVRHDGAYNYASPVLGLQMRLAADTSA